MHTKLKAFAGAFFSVLLSMTAFSAFAAEYEPAYPIPALSGDQRDDVIRVALSQLHYTEADDGSSVYGAEFGQTFRPWCSEFAAWVGLKANVPASIFPRCKSSSQYAQAYGKQKRLYFVDGGVDRNESSYKRYSSKEIPLSGIDRGDIVLLGINDSGEATHTAIVLDVYDDYVNTINGNYNDEVCEHGFSVRMIHAVCKPKYRKQSAEQANSRKSRSSGSGSNSAPNKKTHKNTSRSLSSNKTSSSGSSCGNISLYLPSYVLTGTWEHSDKWRFKDNDQRYCRNQWAAVYNPYAGAGQSLYDWFYFNEFGEMQTGWLYEGGDWYYLNTAADGTQGRLVTGWQWIPYADNRYACYYFNPRSDGKKGRLLTSTVVDGKYEVDANGRWVIQGVVQTK